MCSAWVRCKMRSRISRRQRSQAQEKPSGMPAVKHRNRKPWPTIKYTSYKTRLYYFNGWQDLFWPAVPQSTALGHQIDRSIQSSMYVLTGLSFGSMKNILMIISNSPQPVSVISYGGLVTTAVGNRSVNTGDKASVELIKIPVLGANAQMQNPPLRGLP